LRNKRRSYVLLGTQSQVRKQFGGGALTFAGLVIETFLSGLIASVMMIVRSGAMAEIPLGHDAGWQVQRRDGGDVPGQESIFKFTWPTFFGVALTASAYMPCRYRYFFGWARAYRPPASHSNRATVIPANHPTRHFGSSNWMSASEDVPYSCLLVSEKLL